VKRLAILAVLAGLSACQQKLPPMAAGPSLGLPPLPAHSGPAATEAQVVLGRKLFMDRRLSSNQTMSCAMCHVPEQGFAAVELGTPIGLEGRTLRRNAPTLLNVAYVGTLFHDGRSPTLETQAWAPLLNPIEMGNTNADQLIARIASMPDYAGRFEAAFNGAGPDRAKVAAALAGYQRTLVSGNSRFDRWRYGKDPTALSAAEQAGFAVFAGKGRCIACHTVGEQHALFADARFHNTGLGWARSQPDLQRRHKVQLAPGVVVELAEQSLASVSEPLQDDLGRFEVTHRQADRWAYRTPSLRNVALTAPYMHDGSLATLEEVVEYYQRGGVDNPGRDALMAPLQFTDADKRHLVAFLRSLTGDNTAALARTARAAQAPLAR
jgi:cytochrome c peroxidase